MYNLVAKGKKFSINFLHLEIHFKYVLGLCFTKNFTLLTFLNFQKALTKITLQYQEASDSKIM